MNDLSGTYALDVITTPSPQHPEPAIRNIAVLLQASFRALPWQDEEETVRAVSEWFGQRRAHVTAYDDGSLVGYATAAPMDGFDIWRMDWMAVAPEYRGRGLGVAVLRRLEQHAHSEGARTFLTSVGDDGAMASTSLWGKNLFEPDVLHHLGQLQELRPYALGFYRHAGYSVVGVLPDANGPGMPEILLARSLAGI